MTPRRTHAQTVLACMVAIELLMRVAPPPPRRPIPVIDHDGRVRDA